MSEQKSILHEYNGQTLDHLIVHDGTGRVLPTVIIIPTVMGVQPLEIGFAERLNDLGYHAVIADLFGRRFTPVVDKEAAFAAMGELRADRAALRDRLLAIVDVVRVRPHVDSARVAVIGYCFGGQCALDVARSGVDIAGVASFHGLFDPPGLPPRPIKAKVAAYHGWDDPMVPPEAVVALGNELTAGGCDWQIHAYGNVAHGFTNPNASQMGIKGVEHNEAAARRSWASLESFLDEVFR
ncbi:dienelactone hydrolase family protein [Sphingomonas sp. G124]|uniref:Dienelactone hydrolase family protein n=1 Tax=Sphingomonas cremea TaxID=2904799 RepID=A0A9X1QN91_9SPHN|nr:dienelactone hydrolase family protein [Sphingomonas cremea]MCF2515826.1 dienelactone hydrolase family protein [Sphingomonas cremea]